MGKSKKRKLALFLVLCLLITGMPHVSMRVYADPPANVYMLWALFEEDDVSAIEISNVQPEGMEPFAKLVTGGTYTMSEADNGLGLIVNNATVYTNGMDVAFYEMSGTAAIVFPDMTVSTNADYPAYTGVISGENVEDIMGFYSSGVYSDEAYHYDYTITGNYTGLFDAATLIVNEDAILTIPSCEDLDEDGNPVSGIVMASQAYISGTVIIEDGGEDSPPNRLIIWENGSLTVGTSGSITSDGNGELLIGSRATVTGMELEGNPSDNWETYVYDGENDCWVPDYVEHNDMEDNKYAVRYDSNMGANVKVNGEDAPDGDVFEFELNDEFSITLTPPEGNDNTPVVLVHMFGRDDVDISSTLSYKATDNAGFEILVFWSEEEYEYQTFRPEDGEIVVEFGAFGDGEVALSTPDVDEDKIRTKFNWTKIAVPENTTQLVFTLEGDLTEFFCRGTDKRVSLEKLSDVGASLDGQTFTITLDETGDYSYEFNFVQGGEEHPGYNIPDNKYIIHYDPYRGSGVKINNLEAESDKEYDFSSGDELNITLTPLEGSTGNPVVIVHKNGEINDIDISTSMTYKAVDNAGFEINIFWSEEEYAYNTFNGEPGEIIIEYGVFGDGTVTLNSPVVSQDKTRTDNGWTKVAVSNTTLQLEFTLDGDLIEFFNRNTDTRAGIEQLQDAGASLDGQVLTVTLDESERYNFEIVFYQEGDNPGNDPIDNPEEPQVVSLTRAKEIIESDDYAYYLGNEDADTLKNRAKNYLGKEIWAKYFLNETFNHEGECYGLLETRNDLIDAINLSDLSEFADQNVGLKYYTYTIVLSQDNTDGDGEAEEVTITGKVYVLGYKQFVVKSVEEGLEPKYQVIDASALTDDFGHLRENCDIYIVADGEVTVFGNGIAPVGGLEIGDASLMACHVTQEYSDLHNDELIGDFMFRMSVFPTGYLGVKIQGSVSAAPWEFELVPVYAVGQDGSPSSADVYYGNDGTIGREIKISTALDVRESNINDNYVVSNVSVDTRYLSEDVGVVTQTDDGFLLTTNSAYDEIPLVITYQNGTKGYVTIRRVGIDIVGKHFSDRNFGIAHGTDGVSEFTLPEEYSIDTSVDNQIVTAAFYYATGNTVPSEDERVSLSVTITRVDGTVERKMIPSEKRLNNDCLRANVGEDRYCDGFVLWAGSETEYNKIDKIEAIAFVAGNDDSFGGVQVGSGTGVTWYRR